MPDYIANAFAQPERLYSTDAVAVVKPLSDVSYRLAQMKQAIERDDADAVRLHLYASMRIVSDALLPLCRSHVEQIHERDERLGGGWRG